MAMMDSLSALGRLTSNVSNPQNSVQGYLNRKSRLDELKRNLSMQGVEKNATGQVTSGFASGATPEDIAQVQDDVTEDPALGQKEQDRVAGVQKQNAEDIRYKDPNAVTQRKDALAEALAKAEAPAKAAGAASLAVEHEKNKGLMDVMGLKTQSQKDMIAELQKSGGGGSVDDNGYGGMNIHLGPNGISAAPKTTPQTVLAQREAASNGLSQIPAMRQIIDTLDAKGMIGGLRARAANFGVETGTDPLMEALHVMPPGSSREYNGFKGQLELLKSNLGKVHFGNRASAAIGAKFDKLLNPNQSADALKGGVDTTERWLSKYANAKSSVEQDLANAELGITGGAYERPQPGDDLGKDF